VLARGTHLLAAAGPVAPIPSHQVEIFLLQVGGLLVVALALGRLAMRLGMPAIAGELCAGVLAGPSVLGHVAPGFSNWFLPHNTAQFHLLDAAGQIGVVLLVGLTGVYMDLGMVRRRWGAATRIGAAALIVPLGLGVAAGFLVPRALMAGSASRGTFALFLGVALGVSAMPVIAKTLMDMRMLHRNVGQLILCAVTVDDTVGWLLLSVVSAMATTQLRAGNIGLPIAYLAIVIACAAVARPAVRAVLRLTSRLDRKNNGSTVTLVAALLLLGGGATQALGMEAVFGAFVAGIVISSCRTLEPTRLEPLRTTVMNVFAPLFFAIAGLRIDLAGLAKPQVAVAGLVILLLAILGKVAGAYAGARLSRLGRWEALALCAGVNARGAVEIVVAMVGLRLGVLSPQMYTIIVLIAIVTSLIAPPVLRLTMTQVEHTAEEQLRAARVAADDVAPADEQLPAA
jgi:Kef-type K+ transport system membrane component KefB